MYSFGKIILCFLFLITSVFMGCSSPTDSDQNGQRGDIIPPARIIDMAPTLVTASRAYFSWTAPGDDDMLGEAGYYQIRYATYPISPSNWSSLDAPHVHNGLGTSPAGQKDSVIVKHLKSGTTYYFALIAVDNEDNKSPISNVCEITTLEQPFLDYIGTYYRSLGSLRGLTVTPNNYLLVEYRNYWGMLPIPAIFSIDLDAPIQSNSGVHLPVRSPVKSLAYNNRIFVAGYPGGIYDPSVAPKLTVLGLPPGLLKYGECILADSAHSYPRFGSMVTDGQSLFLASGYLTIVDISAPSSPQLLGFDSSLQFSVNSLELIDSVLLGFQTSVSNTVVLADISDPNSINVLATYEASAIIRDHSVSGKSICLLLENQQIQVVDVSNPATPTNLTEIIFDRPIREIAAAGDYLFTVDTVDGIQMYSLQNPSSPILLTKYDISFDGAYLYAEGKNVFVAERLLHSQTIQLNILRLKTQRHKGLIRESVSLRD